MKNKIIKILIIFVVMLTIFSNFNPQLAIEDPLTNPDAYSDISEPEEDGDSILEMGGIFLGIINTVGVIVSVVTLMIIGIKYMMGSIEERAEFKKSMTGYVIGAIMLFGITTIANILYNIGASI